MTTRTGQSIWSGQLTARRLVGGNSVNGTSGIDCDSVSWSAIGVANRREMVDRTDRESVGCEREGENGRDIIFRKYISFGGCVCSGCVAGVRMSWDNGAWTVLVI